MADVMSRGAPLYLRRPNNEFMAPSRAELAGFQTNKESEWSRVCDNVLDDYLVEDDVFGLNTWQHERTSSDDSAGGAFGYSMSSGQSNLTTRTSPDPTWLEHVAVTAAALDNPMGIPTSFMIGDHECAIVDTPSTSPQRLTTSINTQNPTSIALNKPQSFWDRAVRTLERGANAVTSKRERLRTSKSHPDFLSLGGHPSPVPAQHPVPKVPTVPVPDHTLVVPRSRGRDPVNSKKRATSQVRSVSRGRPQGVAKTGGGAHNGSRNVSPRKASLSPTKMMNPSRYRADVQEALLDQAVGSNTGSPMKAARLVQHHQSLPPPPPAPPLHLQQQLQQRQSLQQQQQHQQHHHHHQVQQRSSFPASPPSSTHLSQHDYSAFGGSPMHAPAPAFLNQYDSELSPLTSTFQQARLHTPDASPFFSQASQAAQSYFEQNVALGGTNYTTTTVPLNDVQNAFPDRTSSLAPNRIGSFDFGFTNGVAPDAWPTSGFDQPSMTALNVNNPSVYTGVHQPTLHQLEHGNGMPAGLGITCDSTVFCPQTAAPQDYTTTVPSAIYSNLQTMQSSLKACYPPMPQASMPTTPKRTSHATGSQQQQQQSPSPPATDSRARRASGGSGLRRVSKHRRTKSATSLPRHAQAGDRGGFVNFTPDDSNKILSGVAPSGSSKTKARREKEAADKRRRLSQAAIKAVLEAGGDAEELVKAGFEV